MATYDVASNVRQALKRGRALKYFTAVRKHYDDMEEDQFDFHSYCLRKMTLRSYVHLLVGLQTQPNPLIRR